MNYHITLYEEVIMNIDLNSEELDLIVQLLSREQKSLPVEIHHSKHREFKDYLKLREKMVENMLDRVSAGTRA
jgi:hypothetical protein